MVAESRVEVVKPEKVQEVRRCLHEVGARLSDVFGADHVLWVEGSTEEECFPLILSKVAKQPLMGTTIVGVKNTGDFDRKRRKLTAGIYRRLTHSSALLPPAMAFIFDKEDRSEQERKEFEWETGVPLFFIPRRMFENYLLIPEAIAHVMASIEEFGDAPTAQDIEAWLQHNQWNGNTLIVLSMSDRTDGFGSKR
jgi:hypothetical protein